MKTLFATIGKRIVDARFELSERIRTHSGPSYKNKLEDRNGRIDDLTVKRQNLIQHIGEAFIYGREHAEAKIAELGAQLGGIVFTRGIKLEDALRNTRLHKVFIFEIIYDELDRSGSKFEQLKAVNDLIDPLLYEFVHNISTSYAEHLALHLKLARSSIQELTVPIVPISDDIAVLPIVGIVDTDRATLIREFALKNCEQLQLRRLVINVYGIPVIDTVVAKELFQIAKSLKLIGVEAIFTGIRPEIAQTLVSLGIDFADMKVYKNVKQALDYFGYRYEPKVPMSR